MATLKDSNNKKTEIKLKANLDEQIKVAHQMLLAVVAYLMFVVVAVLITPKARIPMTPTPPEIEKIQIEHPFGYPRISQTFTPVPCQGEECFELDNFDVLSHSNYTMQGGLSGYQQIRQRYPDIVYLMYEHPHVNYITAYEAGQTYWRERFDFMSRIWVEDGVDWHYFRNQGKTTLITLEIPQDFIPTEEKPLDITVGNCSGFTQGKAGDEPHISSFIKVWNSSNRAGYEIMKVEDTDDDGTVCDNGVLTVTLREVGPSGRSSHSSGENVWNYMVEDLWPYLIRLDYTRNRLAWNVKPSIEGAEYCHANPCQVTDWLPYYAYENLFEPDNNFFYDGPFWDVFQYGAHNENLYTENVDFEGLDELQKTFQEATGELFPGSTLQQTANSPVDYEDGGMTGGFISERDFTTDPYAESRNMILEMVNTSERWQDVYGGDIPLTLINCCTFNTGASRFRFNLILGNILGAFLGGKDNDRDSIDEGWSAEVIKNWIDEYAVKLTSGEAYIKNQADWDNADFSGADPERHYLGYPLSDKTLLTRNLTTPNLVTNGGFESELSDVGWQLYVAQNGYDEATMNTVPCGINCVEGENALYVHIQNSDGKNVGDIEVYRDDLNLQAGKVYTIEYWLKAEQPRVFDIVLNDQTYPDDFTIWDSYVGTEWKRFAYTFKAEENVKKIKFLFGRDGRDVNESHQVDVWIDGIKIQEGDGFMGYQKEFRNGLMLVNPAPSPEGAFDTFKVPEGQYKKILGCTGDAHCDRTHNSGEVIDSAYNNNYYNCSNGFCYLEIKALDGYVLLKTDVNANLDLTLSGDSEVPQSGTLNVDIQVENNSFNPQTVDIWLDLDGPQGDEIRPDPVPPYQNRTINSGEVLEIHIEAPIESDTQTGDYTLIAYVGPDVEDRDNYLDSDDHTFEVTGQGGPQNRIPEEFEIGGQSVRIWWEVEKATLTSPMVRAKDSEASNNRYILTPDGTGNGNGDPIYGQAQYTLNIPQSGNWVIWGRVQAPKGADNQTNDSFFVKMDNGEDLIWDLFQNEPGPYQDTWGWDEISSRGTGSIGDPQFDPMVFNLTEGAHTLYIKTREDGAELDKLLLTNDRDYVPEGVGE